MSSVIGECDPQNGGGEPNDMGSVAAAAKSSPPGYLEHDAVCGAWTERLLSLLYHFFAGRPDFGRVERLPGVEKIAFTTKDHRKLGGYKLGAYADSSRERRGYVLIALGNAMLADQVLAQFQFLQVEGLDVYIYDYRGYGISEGKSRFNAIRSDYVELIQHLNEVGYANRFLYGMSIGGVFLLNAISADSSYDAALLDSPPSRISDYGCPGRFDPVQNVPLDASRLGFIFGHRDKVVPPNAWRELSTIARARGAFVLEGANLAHPMMDQDPIARQARIDAIRVFLMERMR